MSDLLGKGFSRSFWILALTLLVLLAGLFAVVLASRPTTDLFFQDAPDRHLSDTDVGAIASMVDDAKTNGHGRLRLGKHNGIMLIDDHFCGDICPAYTISIVHYDNAPGPACDQIGGLTVEFGVPGATVINKQLFCLPVPLAIARCGIWLKQWQKADEIGRQGWAKPDCSEEHLRAAKGVG